jgi:putative tryptophan/tyrosine transport system substrate-binding protein
MRRRDFIKGFVGSAAAWPLAVPAQQGDRMRRIGVLSSGGAVDDTDAMTFLAAFRQGLEQLGWTEGRNVQIDARFGQGDADRIRKYAAELVALAPDVILSGGAVATEQFTKTTRTVPIVFVVVPDPVGADPIAATYQRIFPGLFKPFAAMPPRLFVIRRTCS